MMGECGCSLHGARCECGRRLLQYVEDLCKVVEQRTFSSFPYEVQQEFLRMYEQARQAYFQHMDGE